MASPKKRLPAVEVKAIVEPPGFQEQAEQAGPRLRVSARPRADGALVLTVTAPAAGRLTAFARAGKPLRTVARTAGSAKPQRGVRLTLRLRGKDLARVRTRKRLATTIRVRFVPKDTAVKALTRIVKARFQYTKKSRRSAG